MEDLDDDQDLFELIDYTSASPLERFIQDLSNAPVQSVVELNNIAYTITKSTSSEYNFLNAYTGTKGCVILQPKSSNQHHPKLLLSALKLAIKNQPVLVKAGISWEDRYEGFYLSETHTFNFLLFYLHYVPSSCTDMNRLICTFKDRFNATFNKASLNASVIVTYEFNKFKIHNSWTNKKNSNWFYQHFSLKYRKSPDPLIQLKLRVQYPPVLATSYLDSEIDPLTSDDWLALLWTNDMGFSCLAEMLERMTTDVKNSKNSGHKQWQESFIPGGYDTASNTSYAPTSFAENEYEEFGPGLPSASMRYYIDSRDIEYALNSLLGHSYPRFETFSTTSQKEDHIPVLSAHQIILSLRFKQLTVPYKSLLWRFAVHLFDSNALRPNYLSFDAGMIPLAKGLWSEFVRQIQFMWDQEHHLPGVDITSNGKDDDTISLSNEHILLHQKLCMLNYCLFKKTGMTSKKERFEIKSVDVEANMIDLPFRLLSDAADKTLDTTTNLISGIANFTKQAIKTSSVSPRYHTLGRYSQSWNSAGSWDNVIDVGGQKKSLDKSKMEADLSSSSWGSGHEKWEIAKDSSFSSKGTSMELTNGSTQNLEASVSTQADENTALKRRGHKAMIPDLYMDDGTPIWEPHTQDSGFMTEDMVIELEKIMESCGTTPQGQLNRAKLQCSQLISDMQAFKAANPGCDFKDFVKWHSPRDWIIDNSGNPTLSERFIKADNLWLLLWKDCLPLEASKQKPLFDIDKEAAKAMLFFENLVVSDVLLQLKPTMFLVAYDAIVSTPDAIFLPSVRKGLQELSELLLGMRYDLTLNS
ncbi:Rab3 GTPase-activating protein catalytic subunit-domain-containing protein [Globomyces pollinis-pini]|nr:Rab3 GTPase-activating protein catalytic subunit-domain-containing protein [Globomyces pollinis-pini]